MTYGPVGIRCPDHAGVGGKTAAPRRAARTATRSLSAYGPFITFTLIGVNVAVFVIQLALGSGLRPEADWIFRNGALLGPLVADGEWWRIGTWMFLHGNIVHIGLNMLVLWFIGPPLEEYFGHWRYLLLYVVSGLAGAAGALIHTPDIPVVGASGAIWGIMGAALVLEARRIWVFGGQAMGLVVFNLALSFLIPGISIGGHIGGLIGGGLCALVFTSVKRSSTLATLSMAGVGLASVVLALAVA